MEKIKEAINFLSEIAGDSIVSKTVKMKIKLVIGILNDQTLNPELRIDKTIQQLDEIAEDVNVPSFTRTQIWNAVSLLESRQIL